MFRRYLRKLPFKLNIQSNLIFNIIKLQYIFNIIKFKIQLAIYFQNTILLLPTRK